MGVGVRNWFSGLALSLLLLFFVQNVACQEVNTEARAIYGRSIISVSERLNT